MTKQTAVARPRRRAADGPGMEAILALWAWLVIAGAFLALALHAASGHIARTDLRLLNASQHVPDDVLPWVELQTYLGNPAMLATCTVLVALVLVIRRAWLEGLLVLSGFAVFAATILIKHMVAEAPPYLATHARYEGLFESNYSFPSGHVVGLSVLGGLVFIFADRLAGDRGLAHIVRVVMLAGIATAGPGRVWLGVHYPTDVIAGYMLAALFLLPVHFCYTAWRRTMRRQTRSRQ